MGFTTTSGKEKAIRSGAEMRNKYRARELSPREFASGVQSQLSAITRAPISLHGPQHNLHGTPVHTGNGQEKVLRQENMVESLIFKEDQKATKLEYDKAN